MGRGLSASEPTLIVPEAPDESDRWAILAGLAQYNRTRADPGVAAPLAILIKDGDGATIGGLWGETLFGWLRIEFLFVPEAMRGSATGSRMMAQAEKIARDRGCRGAWLSTFSFQAQGFYEKLGYGVFGSIPDHPPGGARHFMSKLFATERAPRPDLG